MFQKRDLLKVRKLVSGRGSWSPGAFCIFPLDLQSSAVNYRDTLENILAAETLIDAVSYGTSLGILWEADEDYGQSL